MLQLHYELFSFSFLGRTNNLNVGKHFYLHWNLALWRGLSFPAVLLRQDGFCSYFICRSRTKKWVDVFFVLLVTSRPLLPLLFLLEILRQLPYVYTHFFPTIILSTLNYPLHILSFTSLSNWGREWQPSPIFLPGELYRHRSLPGYGSWVAKSQTQLSN